MEACSSTGSLPQIWSMMYDISTAGPTASERAGITAGGGDGTSVAVDGSPVEEPSSDAETSSGVFPRPRALNRSADCVGVACGSGRLD